MNYLLRRCLHSSAVAAKIIPPSPSFYTARATYYDNLGYIQDAIKSLTSSLTTLHLLPLPSFARDSLAQIPTVWKRKEDMSHLFETQLTTTRYRRITTLLNELNDYRRVAAAAGLTELLAGVNEIVELFESDNKEAILAQGRSRPVKFDQYGRSYTVGRRKTSTARVWLIRTKSRMEESKRANSPDSDVKMTDVEHGDLDKDASISEPNDLDQDSEQSDQHLDMTASASGRLKNDHAVWSAELMDTIDPFTPSQPQAPAPPQTQVTHEPQDHPLTITPTEILVNSTPLAAYFPIPSDRSRVVRPFVVAGLLGSYHVFALVRGGGHTGQSDALALGIARGLVAHENMWGRKGEGDIVETILRRAGLLKRDPRMVERKKPGQAKARKKVCDRCLFTKHYIHLPVFAVCLGQALVYCIFDPQHEK
jgi:small subunit ribosomal protein S9